MGTTIKENTSIKNIKIIFQIIYKLMQFQKFTKYCDNENWF